MEDDIVDFEDFDYGDLGDVNPDDLDIENLERELGLLNEEAPKSDTATQAEPEADKKPENVKKTDNDKKTEASGADETTKTESKDEEKPMNTVNKQSGARPTYTSSGPPKRAPFVPHSAASFPQYPFVHQGMMGMNMMMPPMHMPFQGFPMMMGYPPRPMGNKIHINPKFAAMQNQQRQQQQQQQQQPRMPATNDVTQEEIDRQRQQLLEMQRKRQAEKAANAARASPRPSEPAQEPTAQKRKLGEEEDDREHKRPFTIKGLSKGITIKGAAAAAESSTRKPPGGILDRISSPSQRSSKPILDRISSPGSPGNAAVVSHLNGSRKRESSDRPASQERLTKKQTTIPITAKGTSSTLVIKNLSEGTTLQDIKDLCKTGPGGLSSVDFDQADLKATVTYKSEESAVIMRRRFNRTSFKGSYITISFS